MYDDLRSLKEMGKTLIAYMPTFRKGGTEAHVFSPKNIKSLSDFCERCNIVLLVKLHPQSEIRKQLRGFSSGAIYLVHWEIDPYPLLSLSDALITDYSSLLFDYLLVNRPILFFAHDLKSYQMESRSIYYNYQEFVPGPISRTMQELIRDLRITIVEHDDKFGRRREICREWFFDRSDGNSSKRLWEQLRQRILAET